MGVTIRDKRESRRVAYAEFLRAGAEVGRETFSRDADRVSILSEAERMRLSAPIVEVIALVELIGDETVQDKAHRYFQALSDQINNIGSGVQSAELTKTRTDFVDAARAELGSPRLKREVSHPAIGD